MTTTKRAPKADEISTVATRSNHNREMHGLCGFERSLCRTQDGRWFFEESGGAAMAVDQHREYVDRSEAINWTATVARDPVTGYGYTREQAAQMVDGHDAGRGYRETDGDEHPGQGFRGY